MSNRLTFFVGAVLLAFLALSCSEKKTYIVQSPEAVYGPLDSVIELSGTFPQVPEGADTLVVQSDLEYRGDDGFWSCETKEISVSENPEEYALFDPNSEVIYPGNILQGNSLDQATPDPVPLPRGPGTIVMTLVNGAESVSRQIPEVNLSNVMDAQNQIIQENPGYLPARFQITIDEVQSEQELAFKLGMRYSSSFVSVRSALSFSYDRSYNRFLVRLNQSYYTMCYQMPTSAEELFPETVSPDELSQYVYPGNPAAYVSSVTYGRIFYLLIESTASRMEMDASLTASFSGIFASGGFDAETKFVNELENVQIKCYALGGESASMFHAISSDFETMRDFLAEGGTIQTGVPISYILRSLNHPEKIVSVNLATEYTVTDCVPVDDAIPSKIFWYNGEKADYDNNYRVSLWEDDFGSDRNAVPDERDAAGLWSSDPTVEATTPGIIFCERTPQIGLYNQKAEVNLLVDPMMKIDGPSLVSTDYTIFAVLKPLPPAGSGFDASMQYPNNFIEGVSSDPLQNLSIGFTASNEIGFGHDDTHRMTAQLPFNAQSRLHVYVFRFSQTEGMSIYIDGNPAPLAEDPTLTEALVAYPSPRIGSTSSQAIIETAPFIGRDYVVGYTSGMLIMDFKAYGVAVNDAKRMGEINRLLTKHNL